LSFFPLGSRLGSRWKKFFCVTGVWTQGFMLARQVLYQLSHAPSPEKCFYSPSCACTVVLFLILRDSSENNACKI
jgi:hypothetical protein